MDSSFQILDILLFAAVAGFLLFRLRSVLGRRTGNERPRIDPFAGPKRVAIPPGQPAVPPPAIEAREAAAEAGGATGMAALKAADPSFDPAAFLNGARGAFQMIVGAFAAGDLKTLENLLSKDVFAAFAEAVRTRQAAKETLQTTLVAIKSAAIVEAAIENDAGIVTVKFVSDQINATRSADGTVVDGDPQKAIEKTDFWTFSRSLRARDPNWTLVATHSP